MPFVLMVGLPCSGKTTRALEIKNFLEKECSRVARVISENDVLRNRNVDKNKLFFDSQQEKEIRNVLKSEALRILGQDEVVILDAGNYIKGYRYELYCATKNSNTTQLTVECVVNKDKTWIWNEGRPEEEKYTQEAFEALHLRYEAPDSRNRWDSPLIVLQDTDNLNKDAIRGALFERKPPPPNQSTQSTPLSPSDYLYELDKTTREIVTAILAAQKECPESPLTLSDFPGCVFNDLPANLTSIQLTKLRRQFLNYTKLHPPSSQSADPSKMANMFVQFLNSSLSGSC